jgi:hypothetical protein
MCCRYLYYCRHVSLISDTLYDEYEKVFLKYEPNSQLSKPGSDKEEDYEPHVRALGLYFNFKLTKRKDVRGGEKLKSSGHAASLSKVQTPVASKRAVKTTETPYRVLSSPSPRKKLLIRRK